MLLFGAGRPAEHRIGVSMYGYIYKTTNLINNKIYIGQHKSETFEPHKYIGSGTLLQKAIKKYGLENFKCELLEECESTEELNKKEVFWISELKPEYNISEGGTGGSSKGRKFSETGRKHMSEAKKGSGNTMYGKHHSSETKRKISESKKGRKLSEDVKKRISEGHKGLSSSWKGKHHTEETKQKLRLINLGRPSPSKGLKWNEEQRKKLSNALKGKKIKPHSLEHREKIRLNMLRIHAERRKIK